MAYSYGGYGYNPSAGINPQNPNVKYTNLPGYNSGSPSTPSIGTPSGSPSGGNTAGSSPYPTFGGSSAYGSGSGNGYGGSSYESPYNSSYDAFFRPSSGSYGGKFKPISSEQFRQQEAMNPYAMDMNGRWRLKSTFNSGSNTLPQPTPVTPAEPTNNNNNNGQNYSDWLQYINQLFGNMTGANVPSTEEVNNTNNTAFDTGNFNNAVNSYSFLR